MSRTFGSFEDLLYKLKQFLDTGRWDKEICIKTKVDGTHQGYTYHYYLRKFNYDRSKDTRKLELDIPDSQAIGEPRSIEFEDLKNGKYKITVANFTATGIDCSIVDEMFWWEYQENPRLNAKGGKRRKTRRKRGNGGCMSRKCRRRPTRVTPAILIDNDGNPAPLAGTGVEVENYEVEFLINQINDIKEQMRTEYNRWVNETRPSPMFPVSPHYTRLEKRLQPLLQRYSQIAPPSAEIVAYPALRQGGGRNKKGKGQFFSRRRRNPMIGKLLKHPDDGTIWKIISEQNGIVNLREFSPGTGATSDGFVLGPIDLSILEQVGWKFEGISSSTGSSGGRKRKTRKKSRIKISSNFDAGNILKKRSEKINGICIHTLEINKDPYPKTVKKKYQNWYYFKVSNNKGIKCRYIIENLVNIDNDWKGHNVVYTYDHKTFYRHPTIFNEKKNYITWDFISKKKDVWFSYYIPYSRNRVYKLNKKISRNKNVTKIIIGKTTLKNKIEALRFGKGLKNVYIIARQHPGETIGSWMLEGFLTTFFSNKMKQKAKSLLNKYTFHIISMVNPDGVQLGHWYTQKNGHNCNREWNSKKCPEIRMVYNYINKEKGDIFFDFHGDEGCKKHFFTTCDKTKKNKNSSYHFFQKRMAYYNKNFDKKDYYQKAAHKVHGTFDCCWDNSLTLEGCMKHNYKKENLTIEPLRIGKDLFNTFYDFLLV